MPMSGRPLRLLALWRQRLAGGELKVIAHNSAWLLLERALRLGLGVVVSAWVARYLGPELFGELAYALAFIAFFQVLANLGLDGILVRDIARDPSQAPQLLGTALALRTTVGVLCWLIATVSMVWLHGMQDRGVALVACVGAVLVFQAADTVDLWFQSQSQGRRTVLVKMTAYLVSSGVKVALVLVHARLAAFAAVVALEAALTALGLVLAYRRFRCLQPWHQQARVARQLLAEGWPFIVAGVSITVYMRVDQFMIKAMLGAHQLGLSSVVLPLAPFWQVIPMALNASLAPFVARKKAQGDVAYWAALEKIFGLYAALGWLVCLPTALLSPWLVALLYGPRYQEAAWILSIYVFTNLFINMGVAQGLWLLNEHRSKISLISTLLGALACIAGNWLLLPAYGIAGAAVATVAAQFLSAVLTNLLFSRRIFRLQLRSLVWPVIRL